ncbi:hypothetical protein LguiB_017319 [Lonicera macranthoides]
MGKNLVRNLETKVSQLLMDLEGNELSHAFAFPFREKGNKRKRTDSSEKF